MSSDTMARWSISHDEEKHRPDIQMNSDKAPTPAVSSGEELLSELTSSEARSPSRVVQDNRQVAGTDENSMEVMRATVRMNEGWFMNSDEEAVNPSLCVHQDERRAQIMSIDGDDVNLVSCVHQDERRAQMMTIDAEDVNPVSCVRQNERRAQMMSTVRRASGLKVPRVTGIQQSITVATRSAPVLHHHIGDLRTAPSMAAARATSECNFKEQSAGSSRKCGPQSGRKDKSSRQVRPLARMSRVAGLLSSMRTGNVEAEVASLDESGADFFSKWWQYVSSWDSPAEVPRALRNLAPR
jgi:hypothetical protein